jgi:uncharacterized phiE125 gp8 family phage protein
MKTVQPTLSTPIEIVSLAEVKSHLRVTNTSEDSLITSYLLAAVDWVEGFCHRSFRGDTFTLTAPNFDFDLENPPVASISSVEYKAYGADTYTAITNTNYKLNTNSIKPCVEFIEDYVFPKLTVVNDAVKVVYVAGYDSDTLPAVVRIAILLKCSSFYDKRMEENKRFTTSAESLLMKYKIFSI